MTNLNENDLLARLYATVICISDKSVSLTKSLSSGSKKSECQLQELLVLEVMLEILKCYHIYDPENPDDFELNCLTEEEVHSMFDYISEKCEVCFQRPGFNYED